MKLIMVAECTTQSFGGRMNMTPVIGRFRVDDQSDKVNRGSDKPSGISDIVISAGSSRLRRTLFVEFGFVVLQNTLTRLGLPWFDV